MDADQLESIAKMFAETAIPQWVRAHVIDNEDAMNASLDHGETVEMRGPKGELIKIIPRPA